MKPLILPLAGAAAAAALMASAIPLAAHAQSYVGSPVDANAVVADHGNWTLKDREHWLFSRLDPADGRDDPAARLDSVAGQIHWLHESAFQRPW